MKKEELLEEVKAWRNYCCEDGRDIGCPRNDNKCEQAYQQIVALIKKNVRKNNPNL